MSCLIMGSLSLVLKLWSNLSRLLEITVVTERRRPVPACMASTSTSTYSHASYQSTVSKSSTLEVPSLAPVVSRRPPSPIMTDFQGDSKYCQTMTGEPSFRSIEALWDFIDVHGAFSTMHLDRTHHQKNATVSLGATEKLSAVAIIKEKERVRKLVAMHKHTDLPPFEQFVLFLCLYRKGIDCVDIVAKNFGIGR